MARKTAFEKIEEGLKEALAVARGEARPDRLHIPSGIDVRAIRANPAYLRRISPRGSASRSTRSGSGSRAGAVRWAGCVRICS